MKTISISLVITAIVLGVSLPANAALLNRGTDSLGNRLIYDSDLNLTWYDFTNSSSPSSWYTHLAWASGLSVTIGGVVYDDWRLPTTAITEDPPLHRYDGTTTFGYNIGSSEMGHLFHTELGNKGYYATDSTYPQPGWGLMDKGPFLSLQAHYYYSATSPGPWVAVYFNFNTGEQYQAAMEALGGTGLYSMAVRQGDVIPEPASFSMLLVISGTLLARRRFSGNGK